MRKLFDKFVDSVATLLVLLRCSFCSDIFDQPASALQICTTLGRSVGLSETVIFFVHSGVGHIPARIN